nr:MAG TPA: hypothetical protein [Caudoviricetes sp.]
MWRIYKSNIIDKSFSRLVYFVEPIKKKVP